MKISTERDTQLISRRSFLKLAASAFSAGLVIPALTPPREPYVVRGDIASYIGVGSRPVGYAFIGSAIVVDVGAWDGVGYPCLLTSQGFDRTRPYMDERYYDTDLAAFNREVPDRFWWNEANWRRYKNVHEYVREQRYGAVPSRLLADWLKS